MGLTSINSVAAAPEKNSSLENAAKVLGIIGTVASTAGSVGGALTKAPAGTNQLGMPPNQPVPNGFQKPNNLQPPVGSGMGMNY